MLRQLRLCRRFDALSLFGCRPSISLGPIHGCGLAACNHRRVLSDSPAAAAAAAPKDPRWLMLNLHGSRTDDSFVADAKTVADSHTSTGRALRVSFGRAAPPASSFLYYDFPDSTPSEDDNYDYISVIVAHTDSVLLEMRNRRCPSDFEEDHFVYTAGAAGPPSLSPIPVRDFLTKSESVYAHCFVRQPFRPTLYSGSTGLLRRGESDLLVVKVQLWYDRDARRKMVEFCVLRTGTDMRQWELMEPVPILQDDDNEMVPRSEGNAVIPVGDRYLCWVDCKNGFFLCDMADEARPKVRYVPVPAEVSCCCSSDDHDDYDDKDLFPMKYTKKMGAAGDSSVRFVSIDPHCCCGGPGRSTCAHSRFAFTVQTWIMDLSRDVESPLAWVKDGEMDCEEVWALPGYEGLPRANLLCPVVSLDNPNVVCFLVSNRGLNKNGDLKVWMIQLNLKSKTLLSVVQFTGHPFTAFHHLPAELKYYPENTR